MQKILKYSFLFIILVFLVFVISGCQKATEAQYGSTLEYLKSKCTGTEKIYNCGTFYCKDTASGLCVIAYPTCMGTTADARVVYTCSSGDVTPPSSTCSDECSYSGETQCSGARLKVCGNWDADACFEYKTVSCPSGETCSDGDCIEDSEPSPTPTNECEYGQSKCIGDDVYICSIATDYSLIWKLKLNCPSYYGAGYHCSGEGICSQSDPCASVYCAGGTYCSNGDCIERQATINPPVESNSFQDFLKSYGVISAVGLIIIVIGIYFLMTRKKK